MTSPSLVVEYITEQDARSGFDCGEPALNQFFERYAWPNQQRGIGNTFVHRGEHEGSVRVLGFYTLSMSSLEGKLLPRKDRKHLPTYPLPVALIGRLAVDRRGQGQGLGEALLRDALERVLVAAESVACFAVIVDAKTERAERFYAKFGFEPLGEVGVYPRRMFALLAPMRKAQAGLKR